MPKKSLQKKVSISVSLVLILLFTALIGTTVFAAKAKDRTPPSAPTNLRITSITDKSVSLTWNPSTDNIGVKSYYIYKNSTYIGYSLTTAYTEGGLTPSTAYTFYVKAVDAAGNVSYTGNKISVTTAQSPLPAQNITSKIVGYYSAWSAYSSYTPDKLDAGKLTHINYAFANIGSDLKIALGYPDIDPANFSRLNALKPQYPQLKTLISVGGWSWSGKFSDVALTDASRTAFADSCVAFILKYGFNGIDIDWEYPTGGGLSTNISRPEDKHNFTLLLQKLREKLNAQSALDGKKYLLTIAGGAGDFYINNTEPAVFQQYIDFANMMTYDIHGSWDPYTDFNAPLYNNSDVSPQYKYSVDSAVKAWLKAGLPANKLIVGVPFYGYKYHYVTNVNNGLYQKYLGASAISYGSIVANYLNTSGYIRYFHSQSMVPWLFNGSTFISYDDAQSIGLKAQYIKTNGLAGASIWELSQDPNKVLLTALFNGLK